MPHLINNLYFLNEVCDALFVDALPFELFDCDWTTHPLGFEHLTVTSIAKEVILLIDFEIIKVDVEAETIFIE